MGQPYKPWQPYKPLSLSLSVYIHSTYYVWHKPIQSVTYRWSFLQEGVWVDLAAVEGALGRLSQVVVGEGGQLHLESSHTRNIK